MRELDRIAVIGAGRLGTALSAALRGAATVVDGPLGRDAELPRGGTVVLCVPDAAIAGVAARLPDGTLVGHCSGALGLDVLGRHEGFGLHPLMTVPDDAPAGVLRGAGCAVAGTTPRAEQVARSLAARVGMRAVAVAGEDRAAYHAAASMAANFLVVLEGGAERLAATAGVERDLLAPLVHAAAANWARRGARGALTGPIARGDAATVARQRAAVAERTPELLGVWDALAAATRDLVEAPA